jgi:hypothetical protein
MSYACVQDVPASWETYLEIVEDLGEETPIGLLVHAAGPTDEGFRMIEVWESKAACEQFHRGRLRALGDHDGDPPNLQRTIRELAVEHLVRA